MLSAASSVSASELSAEEQQKYATHCYQTAYDNNKYFDGIGIFFKDIKDWAADTQQTYAYYPFEITNISQGGADIKGTIRIDFKSANDNGGWTNTAYKEYSRHYECGWGEIKKGEYYIAEALVEYDEKGSKGNLLGRYDQKDDPFTLDIDESKEIGWVNFFRTKEGNDLDYYQYKIRNRKFLEKYEVTEPKSYWEWK